MKYFSGLLLALVVGAGCTAAFAQKVTDNGIEIEKNLELMRRDLRSEKKKIIAVNVPFTDTEATKFWPVYDQYAAETERINNDRIVVLKEYAANLANLTDGQALALNNKSLAIDRSFATLRQRFIPQFVKVLKGKNLARFFQIDKRIGLLIDLQIAAGVPIVEP